MAEANWYWAEGSERNGPVAASAIARLVADGKLGSENLIWKEGMPEWIPVSQVPALVKYLKSPVDQTAPVKTANPVTKTQPIAIAAPVVVDNTPLPIALENDINEIGASANPQVSYYNPSGDLPPRAAATLQKHARPRGDVGDWPLDDNQVAQFDQALKFRKKIDSAASLFRLLFLLMVIADVFIVIGGVIAVATARGNANPAIGIGMAVAGAVLVGLSILYYFAWKGTVRSQTWAPLTMGILFSLGGLANLAQFALVGFSSAGAAPALAGGFVSLLIAAAFAYVAFNGFAAIPKYLRQPAWCQELLSKTSK